MVTVLAVAGVALSGVLIGLAWVALPKESFWADENPLRVRMLGAVAALSAGPAAAIGAIYWGVITRNRGWFLVGLGIAATIGGAAFLILLGS